ncbi:MAG: sigma-70 family RNA polymerase sigma factor [Pseudomonadales bacterium]|nr:sigma-70 family RNA polymerase sigma factor [Pseudomonadales bacterium]
MNRLENSLTENHGRFIGLAYRMLGSRTDAEDILQDAYLKVGSMDTTPIRDTEAFLVTMISRMCLDQLKSAHARREIYVGPWLPEPILDAEALTPHGNNELADDLSFALLLTLQKLSSSERAAFLLHDVFDTSFAQISSILGKSEAACRQLAARARKSIHASRPAGTVAPDVHQTLLEEFTEAAKSGNTAGLERLLSKDVIAYTDGGGQKIAALRPIYGADKVTRFFLGITRKSLDRLEASDIILSNINGIPGLIFKHEDEIDQTVTLEVTDGKISAIYMVRNPEKLRALQ